MRIICILLLMFAFITRQADAAEINKIAAVVNGQAITMFDLQKEAFPLMARAKIDPKNPAQQKQKDEILRKTLDGLITDRLITQEARRLQINIGRSEVDGELANLMRSRNLTKKQFEAQLAKENITVDKLRKDIEKNLLRQKIMAMEVGRRVVVTPQEIENYYEAHKSELYNRDGLHMGLLVYHPKAPADNIAAQIKAGKITFEEACAKYSIAPNRDKGGDTGPVEWDRLNPEWGSKLNAMRPGDVTDLFPVQGFKGQIHLFRPGGGETRQLTLQEAKPQIDSILRMPKARERFNDYTRQLRDKAIIDIRL